MWNGYQTVLLRKHLDNEEDDEDISENCPNFEIQYVIVNGHIVKTPDQINSQYFGKFVELPRQSRLRIFFDIFGNQRGEGDFMFKCCLSVLGGLNYIV